jgi:hypothetical protein
VRSAGDVTAISNAGRGSPVATRTPSASDTAGSAKPLLDLPGDPVDIQ